MPAFLIANQQARGVSAEDCGAVGLRDIQRRDAVEHLAQASDLVWIVAAGQDVIRARNVDRQLQRVAVEIYRVVVELLQVFAWRPIDIRTAFLECVESAIEPLDEIWNRAAEMAEGPFDARETIDGSAEDKTRRRERRVQRKADQRHQPVIFHGLNADRRSGMDVDHGAEIVRRFPHRPEAIVAERDAIDVAENHRAAESELTEGALELLR